VYLALAGLGSGDALTGRQPGDPESEAIGMPAHQITFAPTQTEPQVPVKAAARAWHVSNVLVYNMLSSGLIDDLGMRTVGTVAQRDIITSATSLTGRPVAVLRLGEKTVETNPAETRKYYGYAANMTDQQVLDAAARWWQERSARPVLDSGVLLVVRASFIVAALDVFGIADRQDDRVSFEARMVVRSTDAVENTHRVLDDSSSNIGLAERVVNCRALGGGGGPITLLPSGGAS